MLQPDLDAPAGHPLAGTSALTRMVEMSALGALGEGFWLSELASVVAASFSDTGVAVVLDDQGESVTVRFEAAGGQLLAECDCPHQRTFRLSWCKHRAAVAFLLAGLSTDQRRYGELVGTETLCQELLGIELVEHMSGYELFDDRPLAETLVTPDGLRHLPDVYSGWGEWSPAKTACGATGELEPATAASELCGECLRVMHRR
jgi:hypothetical protein